MNFSRLIFLCFFIVSSGCLTMEPRPGVVVGNPEVDEETSRIDDEELPEIGQLPPAAETPPDGPPTDDPFEGSETPEDEGDHERIDPIVKEPTEPEAVENPEISGMDRVGETDGFPAPSKNDLVFPWKTLDN